MQQDQKTLQHREVVEDTKDLMASDDIHDNPKEDAPNTPKLSDSLIIEYPKEALNGMMQIKLPNLDDLLKDYSFDDIYLLCTFLYKFKFETENKHYPNDIWQDLRLACVSEEENQYMFWVKVPLLLSSYELYFRATVSPVLHGNPSKPEIIENWTSKEHSMIIPSILMAKKSTFKVGDLIQYYVPNSSWVEGGIIQKLLENDIFEIKPTWVYNESTDMDKRVKVHKDKIARAKIYKTAVMNIANPTQAVSDLILRTDNGLSDGIFKSVTEALYQVYINLWWYAEIGYTEFQARTMVTTFGCNIYQYLYRPEYIYRVNCLFHEEDNHELFCGESMPFHVKLTLEDQEQGLEVVKLQECWTMMGYACEICRVEIGYFEYMWHCKHEKVPDRHAYCLTCVHSMVQQYNEMEQFLADLLLDIVDMDCIIEIVAYCVGKVKKFEI